MAPFGGRAAPVRAPKRLHKVPTLLQPRAASTTTASLRPFHLPRSLASLSRFLAPRPLLPPCASTHPLRYAAAPSLLLIPDFAKPFAHILHNKHTRKPSNRGTHKNETGLKSIRLQVATIGHDNPFLIADGEPLSNETMGAVSGSGVAAGLGLTSIRNRHCLRTVNQTFLLLPAIFSLHFSAEAEESDRQQPSSRRGTPQSSQSSRRHREKYPVDQEDSRQLKKSILAILKGLDTSTSPTSTFQPSAGE
ncbi:hypothetical protein CISG_00743 [Coccidioides immitis RMSCC 3703]|uniref:Uncharacterized protein n=1 Tax=Coccidioides immitis RMSCC 3703 TaxID=454286 RepID=A0A0J8QU72_COCIT|nr:hypothetical protein CISG_00743 [Coccidioides immitis RMSCC 3703]